MKKTLLFILMMMALAMPCSAKEVWLGSDANIGWFAFDDTIRDMGGNKLRMWHKAVFDDAYAARLVAKGNFPPGTKYYVQLAEYDTKRETVSEMTIICYDRNGNMILKGTPLPTPQYIPHFTWWYKLMMFAKEHNHK
jgi:hypothetical protein